MRIGRRREGKGGRRVRVPVNWCKEVALILYVHMHTHTHPNTLTLAHPHAYTPSRLHSISDNFLMSSD